MRPTAAISIPLPANAWEWSACVLALCALTAFFFTVRAMCTREEGMFDFSPLLKTIGWLCATLGLAFLSILGFYIGK